MKLNNCFIQQIIEGQTALVPVRGAPFRGLVQGIKSVEAIFDCVLTQMNEIGAIDE